MRTLILCVTLALTGTIVHAQSDESYQLMHQNLELESLTDAIDMNTRVQAATPSNNAVLIKDRDQLRDDVYTLNNENHKLKAQVVDAYKEIADLKRQRSNAVIMLQNQWEELQKLKSSNSKSLSSQGEVPHK